jgi:hypothetical protein
MIVYWLMFLLAAVACLASQRRAGIGSSTHVLRLSAAWWAIVLVLTLLIGFRFKVGGDWEQYLGYVLRAGRSSLLRAMRSSDPGYQVLNWMSANLGFGIWGVNVVCGLIFSIGLARLCRHLPRPWLALAVAIPYMVIVVAMGYTRQGVALGLAMLGLVALSGRQIRWFVIWVMLAATFHKSAVLLLPIAVLAHARNRYWTAVWVGVVTIVAYYLFLVDSVEMLYTNYVEAQYQSSGALIRLAMNAMPAAILLIWRRRFNFPADEAKLWLWFAIISIVLLVVLQLTPASTAVDRVALYMLPLQLVVFAYLPDVFGRNQQQRSLLVVGVLAYYAVVQFVWLNYAQTAFAWLPYRFYM